MKKSLFLFAVLFCFSSCLPGIRQKAEVKPLAVNYGKLYVEGQFIVESNVAASWCGASGECQVEVSDVGYLVTPVGSGFSVIRREAINFATPAQIVPYDPEDDICLTEPELIGTSCSPNYVVTHLGSPPDDEHWDKLWGMERIRIVEAWETVKGNQAIIAVLDTGLAQHIDIKDNILGGYNAIDGSDNYTDTHYHGSHTAGTACAVTNNAVGVAGVSYKCRVYACKFLGSAGGTYSDAIECIHKTQNLGGGGVISNNSWGGGGYSQPLKDAIYLAGEYYNMLFIAAAGNDALNTDVVPHYPSSYDLDNIISVAALAENGSLAAFSNYGVNSVDIAAPGVDIKSLHKDIDKYSTASGTSMATPHVAGVAALIREKYPDMHYSQIKNKILNGAKPNPALVGKVKTAGELDAVLALAADAGTAPTPTPTPNPCDSNQNQKCIKKCKKKYRVNACLPAKHLGCKRDCRIASGCETECDKLGCK